jgi:outer membrane immunogenic protein
MALWKESITTRDDQGGAMKRLLSCAGALVLACVAQTSLAADMPVKAAKAAAVVAPPFSWTGPYWGLHCGAAWGKTHSTDFEDGVTVKPAGGFCGGQLGYNWQNANWVVGAEGDLGYFLLRDTNSVFDGVEEFEARVKYGWYGTLTGRLGIAADRSLFYLKGGAAFARITNIWTEFNAGVIDESSQISKTKAGWTAGGGWEYAVAPNWSWKIEYLYMDFGKTRTTSDDEPLEHRNRVHTVKLGVNYRFATGKYPVAPVVTKY